jgi:cytochrome P450
MEYDPFDPIVHADPDRAFAELRRSCPVHHQVARDFFTVSRTPEITAILRTPELWSSRFRNGLEYRPPAGEPMLLDADPPIHTWQRRLLQKAWTPRLINQLEDRVREIVDALMDTVAADGRCDFHETVSASVPTMMIAEFIGVPVADRHLFKAWSDARVDATGGMPGHERSEAAATAALEDYFREHIRARRAQLAGGDRPSDYTTMIMTTTEDGHELTDGEVQQVLQLLLLGGIETTTLLLSNLLHRVIVEPELAATLSANPALFELAVEESLRVDAPTLGLFRTPNETTEVAGVEIPKDTKTMVLFAAVNRDPGLWDDPDSFRLDREPTQLFRHFGFGHGNHRCLGAPLARLEGRVVLERIVARWPAVRYEEEPHRIDNMIFRGYDRQLVSWQTCA